MLEHGAAIVSMPTYCCRCAAVKVEFELSMAPTWKRQATLLRRMCRLTDWLVGGLDGAAARMGRIVRCRS